MRSHIFPQFLLKQWIKCLWEINDKKLSLFFVDLVKEQNYLIKDIFSENDIEFILKNERTFYLNVPGDLILEYEKEWNKDYEQPFFKFYNQCLKIYKQYFEKNNLKKNKKISSYEKEIYNELKSFQKNPLIILNFLYLNIFRAQFIREPSKLVDIDGNIEYKNLSEMLIEVNIKIDKNDIRDSFERFKNSFTKKNYQIFIIPQQLYFMANPPIYNFKEIFFAIPLSPIGFLCLIDSEYEIEFIFNCPSSIKSLIKFQKTDKKYNDTFNPQDIFKYDNNKYSIYTIYNGFVHTFLTMWIKNYGYSRGNIYFLGNQDSVNDFTTTFLKENHCFEERQKYMSDDNNYDLSNTAFVFKLSDEYEENF